MDQKDIIILRNTFYKCFFIGLGFLILSAIIYLPFKSSVAHFYHEYLGISLETYYYMWVCFVGLIKTILIFIFLVPALALHWTSIEKH